MFFSSTHVSSVLSLVPNPSFILFFSLIQEHSSELSFSLLQFSLSLSLLLDFRTFTSSLYNKKRKKRGIERKNKIDGSLCCYSSSSPTQSRWVRWLLSFFFFFKFFMIWLILKLCFWVCILIIWLYLSLEMFERKPLCLSLWEERERIVFIIIEMYEFLSRKLYLELRVLYI